MTNEQTINELLSSINKSIEDIREHPTKTDELPSNLEILVRGVSDSKAIDFLFSTKLDKVIENLFKKIESGDFEDLLSDTSELESIAEKIFGKGSFTGPISKSILNNIQGTLTSQKYNTMKSNLGKSLITLKRIKLIMKNLEKGKQKFKDNPENYKKYKDAVYAIKSVLKFVERIYRNRRIINKKVFNGLNNIVHEDFINDEPIL